MGLFLSKVHLGLLCILQDGVGEVVLSNDLNRGLWVSNLSSATDALCVFLGHGPDPGLSRVICLTSAPVAHSHSSGNEMDTSPPLTRHLREVSYISTERGEDWRGSVKQQACAPT